MIDLSLEIRRAIVAHLKADATVTALVPANRIYGEFAASDQFPFIRMGYSATAQYEAQGWDGSEGDFAIHIFAGGPGTDAILTIAKRVVASMTAFAPASIEGAYADWLRTDVVPDEVPQKLHAIVVFAVRAYEIA